jgi:uncharacterized membrane protein YdjX (TVP38/TMEM64 family)
VPTMRIPRNLIAALVLIALIAAVWILLLTGRVSWSGVARNQAALTIWVGVHPLLAAGVFFLVYLTTVALSLPQGGFLTITGGYLFGTIPGGALAVAGATTGAVFLFLIARSAFAGSLARRGGPRLGRLRDELRRDGFSYLLAVRLVPVVPFWLVNLAAALCGMRLDHFIAATLIGIMPASFVIASIGSGLGDVVAQGETPDLHVLVSWPVLGPLLALALLSVIPVVWRKWRHA